MRSRVRERAVQASYGLSSLQISTLEVNSYMHLLLSRHTHRYYLPTQAFRHIHIDIHKTRYAAESVFIWYQSRTTHDTTTTTTDPTQIASHPPTTPLPPNPSPSQTTTPTPIPMPNSSQNAKGHSTSTPRKRWMVKEGRLTTKPWHPNTAAGKACSCAECLRRARDAARWEADRPRREAWWDAIRLRRAFSQRYSFASGGEVRALMDGAWS
ncbi:hypothetical protein K491DRAFT_304043 [Lophiostoma macrostomum CBS 122681]|uniref:Uncharacterized protein n=1 Tax=Lophiostoma macrostomum CBS 122681 TaxID=1314788 RepID=A0A6A6SLL6_9PLEO|nr:hypothetical protein K491DRAFT_304043 [Lophiostoma macrostomum CBS 122681]